MARDRVVLHVDMDAFYVSVELRRRPELVGQPVVVGGTGRRGVVAAASYEARRFGIHSALPSAVARRRCPHAVFLPGDHAHYAEVSAQVHDVFHRFTPLVEPLALDEAFLDVTGVTRLFGDGRTIAARIRQTVRDELDLGCSVGVAPNKFLAKLASVEAKPVARPERVEPGLGIVEVAPGEELAFVQPLPVERLWGVGPKTLEKLDRLGVRRVGDLARLDPVAVQASLGRAASAHLLALAQGVDDRPVEVDREPKSIGHEETFEHDLHTTAELGRELVRLCDAVSARLRRHRVGARTVTLKVRFAGFTTITRSVTGPEAVDTASALVATLRPVLEAVDAGPGVRLLGVSTSNFATPAQQLDLFGSAPAAPEARPGRPAGDRDAALAVDAVRERFGAGSIGPASAVRDQRLRVARPGAQQWGPDHEPGPGAGGRSVDDTR
jgi:DNA polymerase-4